MLVVRELERTLGLVGRELATKPRGRGASVKATQSWASASLVIMRRSEH